MSATFYTQFQHYSDIIKQYITAHKLQCGIVGSTLFAFLSRYIYGKFARKFYQFPPGPEGIPIFGCGLHTILFPNTWPINLATTYGPIVFYKAFGVQNVLINDSEIIKKQILNRNDDIGINRNESMFTDPNFFMLWGAKDNTIPFLFVNGNRWFKARKNIHSSLLTILNTKYVNNILSESINNSLIPELNLVINNKNGEWYPRQILTSLTFHTIFQANFGETTLEHKLYKQILSDFDEIGTPRIAIKWFMCIPFPFLKYIPFYFNELTNLRMRLHDNIESMIKKRESEYNNDDNVTFIDQFRLLRQTNEISSGQEIADIMVMFAAGTETTASTLEWGIVLLSKQYDIQNEVRNELKNVIKNNELKNVLYDNKLLIKLPLFRALIREILRISSVSKYGVQHYLKKGKNVWITTKNGKKYMIPGDTTIYYNTDYIHNFSKTENWKNDNLKEICLENWLKQSKDLKQYEFVNNPSFLTFGFGRRDCMGKSLAFKEIRIVLGFLLLHYRFTLKNIYQPIKDSGGRPVGAAKLDPQIPVLVEKI
eukprot:227528_1